MEQVYSELIKDKDYCDIAKFVEELYLSDFDLVILMARKFFTLFLIFHELNSQKYVDLDIPYKSNKKIITNVALPLYRDAIIKGEYKRIVIADDIIIHGRGVSSIFEKLKSWNDDCDVQIVSYLRNDENTVFYYDKLDYFHARYLVESDYWKLISTKIVDSFYITGRPYISYLPYFTIKNSWEEIINKLGYQDFDEIDNETMRCFSVKGLLYTGEMLKCFQAQEYCKICALRFYHYERANKTVVLPYFCMDVINNPSFYQLSNSLRKNRLNKEYRDIIKQNQNADEMRLLEIEYILSYWMGIFSLKQFGFNVDQWNYDSEVYSFGMRILRNEKPSADDILTYLCELEKDITETISRPKSLIQNDDIALLAARYSTLRKKYSEKYDQWNARLSWQNKKSTYERLFLEELLSINGKIDEKRLEEEIEQVNEMSAERQAAINELCFGNGTEHEKWLSDEKKGKKRLLGLPLTYILQDMGESFKGSACESEKKHRSRIFADIISVVDSGKGSIFTRIVADEKTHNDCYFESLLHAGEQNYVFYENTNFPTMYAFYMIEQASNKNCEKVKEMKAEFLNYFKNFLKENNIYYDKEDMQQLEEIDISRNYGRYLLYAYFRYKNNSILKQAIEIASLIVAKY